jgi:hypothetical protein
MAKALKLKTAHYGSFSSLAPADLAHFTLTQAPILQFFSKKYLGLRSHKRGVHPCDERGRVGNSFATFGWVPPTLDNSHPLSDKLKPRAVTSSVLTPFFAKKMERPSPSVHISVDIDSNFQTFSSGLPDEY